MASNWIKLEHSTLDKEEIIALAAKLNIDQDAALGKCARLWVWADQNSVDGNAMRVTDSFLDRLTNCPGFANALREVGWLSGRDCLLTIPNFLRHNGQSAKKRALTKDRVELSRANRNATSVTDSLPDQIRSDQSTSSGTNTARRPSLEQVKVKCQMLCYPEADGVAFWHHFEASGWIDKNQNRVVSWESKLATWMTTQRAKEAEAAHHSGNGSGVMHSKELDRVLDRMKAIKNAYSEHQSWTKQDIDAFQKLKERRNELRQKLGVKV